MTIEPDNETGQAQAGHAFTARLKVQFLSRASSFLRLLPALLAGLLLLRTAELAAGMERAAGLAAGLRVVAAAAGLDLLSLARHLPLIFLLSLPFLGGGASGKFRGLAAFWSLLLLAQEALTQYFFQAGVPLGADLYAYTLEDIIKTVRGSGSLSITMFIGIGAAIPALWAGIAFLLGRGPFIRGKTSAAILAASLPALLFLPAQPGVIPGISEYSRSLAVNKSALFADETLLYFSPFRKPARKTETSSGLQLGLLDPAYPFLRQERTFDSLGPFLKPGQKPPNLVILIAEGLGRDFSGPDAVLGSFTPKLDSLAAGGLYWENFLANQGRTFGVLPSLLASLPFGRNGLAELGEKMPRHVSLLSVLKKAGYRIKVYCGFNSDFDNDRIFYRLNGADSLTDELSFGPGYAKSNSWGYADRELFSRALSGEERDGSGPSLTIIKTSTMHTPYSFLGQQAYYPAFERRLDELGIAEDRKPAYRKYRDIYTSILYFDDEFSRLAAGLAALPSWRNTILVITGDHRLPEIPMSTRISRYHVPLIIISPLLKAPARFKAVSSHLDVTPSLLALLANRHGLLTPRTVTWLGAGLDTNSGFRNVQTVPMMQTKTDLVDFISGYWYYNRGSVYRLRDSMQISLSEDKEALRIMTEKFAAFRAANEALGKDNRLMPEGAGLDLAPYSEQERLRLPETLEDILTRGLSVREVRVPESAAAGSLSVEVTFANPGPEPSPAFVPLAVLMTEDNKELTETYGGARLLKPDGSLTLRMDIKSGGVPPGRYYLAVIASHPETGKSLGAGKYRIPVRLTAGGR